MKNTNLPVIRVFRSDISVGSCSYASVEVPGRTALSMATALRIAADAIEALSSKRYEWRGPLIEQDTHSATVRLAVFGNRQDVAAVIEELRLAAQREACLRTARHPTGITTHRVEVQTWTKEP